MTFQEIFDKYAAHSYIRRSVWPQHEFIQLMRTKPSIRRVKFEPISSDAKEYAREPMIITLQEHITLGAEDLSADDWIDIEDC